MQTKYRITQNKKAYHDHTYIDVHWTGQLTEAYIIQNKIYQLHLISKPAFIHGLQDKNQKR